MKNSFEMMKERNQKKVLEMIYKKGPISRVDISDKTGLAAATITNIVKKLLELGLVKEAERAPSSGGRKPVLMEINKTGGYFIGIEWGINKVSGVLLNLKSEIVAEKHIQNSDFNFSNFIDLTSHLIEKMENKAGSSDKIIGLGLGIHGPVNPRKGLSLYAPHFNWKNKNIKEEMVKLVDYPVFIDNDVRMMALGEKWGGVGKNYDNFIFVNLGYGIGSGIIINGELYYGNDWTAGEFGHMTILEEGPICSCGNQGCLEAVISIDHLVKKYFNESEKSNLYLETKQQWTMLNQEAQREKNAARNIILEAANYLGTGLANLVNLFNPRAIILGGDMMTAEDYILPVVREKVNSKSLQITADGMEIHSSSYRELAGARGAATAVLEDIFK